MQMVTTVAEWGAAPVRQKRRTARIDIGILLMALQKIRSSFVERGSLDHHKHL